MKRGAPDHPKTKQLAELLGVRRVTAVGHLEMLFHFTASYAPAGDIGRYSDKRIAAAVDWAGRPEKLIAALQQAGFIEPHPTHRLIVHDWQDHADAAVRKRLERAKIPFVCSQQDTEKVTEQCPPSLPTMSASSRALSMPTPTPEPDTHPLPPLRPALPPKPDTRSSTPPAFDVFWRRYPHKVGKDAACRAWLSVVNTPADLEAVFGCLERWERSDQWARKVYQKPENWLWENARSGWQDRPAEAATGREIEYPKLP